MAAEYPPKLVIAVLKAIKQEATERGFIGSMELQSSGPVPSKPMFDLDDPGVLSAVVEAWDDVTGSELPPDLVLAARKEEIDEDEVEIAGGGHVFHLSGCVSRRLWYAPLCARQGAGLLRGKGRDHA